MPALQTSKGQAHPVTSHLRSICRVSLAASELKLREACCPNEADGTCTRAQHPQGTPAHDLVWCPLLSSVRGALQAIGCLFCELQKGRETLTTKHTLCIFLGMPRGQSNNTPVTEQLHAKSQKAHIPEKDGNRLLLPTTSIPIRSELVLAWGGWVECYIFDYVYPRKYNKHMCI